MTSRTLELSYTAYPISPTLDIQFIPCSGGREGREGKILCGRRKPQKKTTEARIHSERKVR